MIRVHLVRHGRASAGWDTARDPDLDELGWRQAHAAADQLADLEPQPVVSSPLLRCRSTAAPLCERWGRPLEVVDAVAEIPSPPGVAMADRTDWLRAVVDSRWTELDQRYRGFRDGVVDWVRQRTVDTVVFSHFIAINTVIGAALQDDRVVVRRLDNASITVIGVDGPALVLLEGGREADTLIR